MAPVQIELSALRAEKQHWDQPTEELKEENAELR